MPSEVDYQLLYLSYNKKNMKKYLIPILALSIYTPLMAQANIYGQFTNIQNWSNKVYLQAIKKQADVFSSTEKYLIDTAIVSEEGYFEFKMDKLPKEECLFRLDIRPKDAIGAFLYVGSSKENYALFELKNSSSIKITANADQLTKSFKIEQSGNLWTYEKIRKVLNPFYIKADSVENLLMTPQYLIGKNIDSLKKQLLTELMNVYEQNNKLLLEYISHSDNFYDKIVGLNKYDYDSNIQNDIEVFETVLKQVKEKRHPYIEQLQQKIYETKYVLPVGSQASQFVISDSLNNPISLYSVGKNLILLDFWASWCGPCRLENKTTVKPLYEHYKAKGFAVVSVSLDDDRNQWLKAIKNDKMSWVNISDLKGTESPLYKLYKIESLPTTYLIEKEGHTILAKNIRGSELEKFVKEYYEKR